MGSERGKERRGRREGAVAGAGGGEGGARVRAGSRGEAGNNNMFLLNFSKSLTQVFIYLTLINKKTPNDNNLKINGLLGPLAHQPPSHLAHLASCT